MKAGFYHGGVSIFPTEWYDLSGKGGDDPLDLVKIGRYLAEKRRALGMTQRQVAERLGMSDKSVSKWERGVCLPDVSIYQELCAILGISINEFLAGEDIGREDLEKRAEDNLLAVTAEGRQRQKRMKAVAAVLLAAALLSLAVMTAVLIRGRKPVNVIAALEKDSVERSTAELISGVDGAYLYRYAVDFPYRVMTVTVYQYERGRLTDRQCLTVGGGETLPSGSGMVAIVPDFARYAVKLVLADEKSKLATDVPILEEAPEEREYYGRAAVGLEGTVPIRCGEERGLLTLVYDPDEMRVLDLSALEQGEVRPENAYMYYFTVAFAV